MIDEEKIKEGIKLVLEGIGEDAADARPKEPRRVPAGDDHARGNLVGGVHDIRSAVGGAFAGRGGRGGGVTRRLSRACRRGRS